MSRNTGKIKKLRDFEGITLIALIITIIILLILAGISIASLTGSGLFNKVKEAKEKTENAQAEENAILDNYAAQIDEITGGTSGKQTLASKVKVGDYVSYTPDTASTTDILNELSTYSGNTDSTKNTADTLTQENDLKWRVLDVQDGKVRLISEVPTTSTVALEGYNGYNNAVYLLDKICNTLYNKRGYTEKVQNLKIEDVEKYMVTKPTTDSTTYSPTKKYYPSIFAQEKDQTIIASDGTTQPETRLDLSEQATPINQTASQEATSWSIIYKYWSQTMELESFKDGYYNLFINNGNNYSIYWMSSRSGYASTRGAGFSVRTVISGQVGGDDLYHSDGSPTSGAYALRPVITLSSNVLVKSGDGTLASEYEISL